MTQTKHFKTKIQLLLISLVLLGLIATTFVGGIGWWASQNLSMTIDTLGKSSLALSEGNMAISNTIANYLDRQERIIATSKLDELNQNADKTTLKTNFQQQYQTLVKNLAGLDINDAAALNTVFIQFDQYDNQLFTLQKALLQSQQTIEQHVIEVNATTDRIKTYTNNMAAKVTQFQEQSEQQDLSGILWMFSNDREEAARVSDALVDKNSAEKNAKSLISLHILNLEKTVQKIRLANDLNALQHITTTEVSPILHDLHDKLNEVKNTDIQIEDYDVIVQAVAKDVDQLRQQLTSENNSLITTKTSLLQQTQRFENIQQKLEQTRTKLLGYLDQLTQSGDILARRTNQKATLVMERTRTLIIAVGIGMLLIFLVFSRAIARRINLMAITIKAHSDELAAANHTIQQAHNKLTESNQLITESIGYASKIQRAIQSPSEALNAFSQDHFSLWLPRDTVGGDSYWIRPWGYGHLILFADCTGHGVPGAFMTILTKAAMDKALPQVAPGQTSELINSLHQIVQSDLGQDRQDSHSDDGLDLGVCYITDNKQKITFSGARLSLIYTTTSGIQEIKGDKTSIGYRGLARHINFTEHQLNLTAPTRCYLITDGFIDQIGGNKAISFGKRRLFKLIKEMAAKPMVSQANAFESALQAYQGTEERRDDVTVLGFSLVPASKSVVPRPMETKSESVMYS